MTDFKQLNLNEPILRAVAAEHYKTPTQIQAKTIPIILEGKDVLGCAQTGTRKTAAFLQPMLQRLSAKLLERRAIGSLLPLQPGSLQHKW